MITFALDDKYVMCAMLCRYADPADPSLIMIYDQAGYIAGSQSGLLVVSSQLQFFH